MELRLTVCLAIFILAVTQCSVFGHTVQRRQALDDANYDEAFFGDEAGEDEAQNDAETDNSNHLPQQKEPAVILTPPTKYEVKQGGDVVLQCKVSPEDGTVVQWYKNEVIIVMGSFKLIEDPRYSFTPATKELHIKNITRDDSGVYKCAIPQKVNPTSINHTLVVPDVPKVVNTLATNNGEVGEGTELTLACTVSGTPTPQVIWSVTKDNNNPNQRLTEKDGNFSGSGNVHSLYVKKIRLDQAGKYYCYALNNYGSDQGEFNVIVHAKPKVHVPRTAVNSDLQVAAVLECSAHEAPEPNFRWYKDGELIEDSSSQFTVSTHGSHSNLTVLPTADKDFGTFTCEANNHYGGKHNKSIDLVQSPVVEGLDADGAKMTWTVHSHQPLEEMEVQLRNYTGGEWKTFSVPVPQGNGHKYEVTYVFESSQVGAGKYQAIVKVKNNKSWGSSTEPILVEIEEATPMYIQHASVFRTNSAHSIRTSAVASTILMYLLVRML